MIAVAMGSVSASDPIDIKGLNITNTPNGLQGTYDVHGDGSTKYAFDDNQTRMLLNGTVISFPGDSSTPNIMYNYSLENGSTVIFNEGNFTLNQGLTIGQSMNIKADGDVNFIAGSSINKTNTATTNHGIHITASNVNITGISVEGFRFGISTSGANNVNIIDCDASDNWRGINLQNSNGVTIKNTTMNDNDREGINFAGNNTNVHVSLSNFTGNGYEGIHGYAKNSSVTNSTISENGFGGSGDMAGVDIHAPGGLVFGDRDTFILENNTITDNAGDGVLVDAVGVKIRNNIISGNAENGIHVEDGKHNEIIGNTVFNNDANGIVNEAEGTVIKDNNVYDNAGSNIVNYDNRGGKSQSNITELWFDNPWGYIIGQIATILWNFEGVYVDDELTKTITLFYYSNGILQRTEVVPLWNPITVNGIYAMGHHVTNFTQIHDELIVVAVIAEDPDYLRSEQRNSTFVDLNDDFRRVDIEVHFPEDGLKVGVASDIYIEVTTFDGNPVEAGSITILWDGLWRFDVDVRNGHASFTHTYSQAGDREVSFTYNGEEKGTRVTTVTEEVEVEEGNPTITVTLEPAFAVVGQEVTIAGAINNFALGSDPEYVKLEFKAGNHVWHTIDDIPMTFNTANSAIAQVTYIFTMAHTNLSLVMSFEGNDDYAAASGSTTTIVTPAPEV